MNQPAYERDAHTRSVDPRLTETHLARVTAVNDDPNLARVQIRLYSYDGPALQDGPLWARVATPLAGNNRGAYLIPDVGDEVLVTFVGGDARFPVIIGSLWNGEKPPIATHGGQERGIDTWVFQSKAGTKISITEQSSTSAVLRIEMPGEPTQAWIEMRQESGGKIEISAGGSSLTLDSNGASIQTSGEHSVDASTIVHSALTHSVDCPASDFAGLVDAPTLISDAVVGSTYTPGAGNIW